MVGSFCLSAVQKNMQVESLIFNLHVFEFYPSGLWIKFIDFFSMKDSFKIKRVIFEF